MSARIDAHLHLWRLARGDYGWITDDLVPLRRDFEPADACAELTEAGMTGAVVIQAAPTVEETRFLLDHAKAHPWIRGVVGWVDLEAPDAPDQIEALAQSPKLKGIRPMIQDIPDPAWMLRSNLAPAVRRIEELDRVFEALVKPFHLPNLIRFLERHDRLRVVIDHGAKPAVERSSFEPWAAQMRAIAGSSSVLCKLSGLVTEAGRGWTLARLRPYVDHLVEVFGPERLVFGSDWPVVTLACPYQEWLAAAETLTAPLRPDDRERIFGRNAVEVYRLA